MEIVGVDTGGTFTDFVFRDGQSLKVFKIPSTPANPAAAVLKGLERLGKKVKVIHGSTVATNTVLERKGAKVAFVTNEGFKDVPFIRRQNRLKLYELHYRHPAPLVSRKLSYQLSCRVLKDASILKELEEDQVKDLIRKLKDAQVESVAVCFLFSFLNCKHERLLKEALEEEGFFVSISCEVSPEFREYERSSTTILNAYVLPKMKSYLSQLKESVPKLFIVQSNGGQISAEVASKFPVRTLLSGPAAGVVGAWKVAKLAGFEKVITLDMGGTSTDVSLIDGKPSFKPELSIGGFPAKVPCVDIHTIGAGGGSIAKIDEGGALLVGPESAGATPGPICYGKGGKEITITDANVFLRRIIPESFLQGSMRIYPQLIEPKIKSLAQKVGMDEFEFAEGIVDVANAKMERALKVISVERGYDPKDFVLLAFGGAGALHAAFLARSLAISKILVPKHAGVLSALGMLLSDFLRDYWITVMFDESEIERAEAEIKKLEERAFKDMLSEGFEKKDIILEKFADVRYKGQGYELTVPFERNLRKVFEKRHEKLYGYTHEGPIEIVNLRLRATGVVEKPKLPKHKPKAEPKIFPIEVFVNGTWQKAVFADRETLPAGFELKGPAVVAEYSSTAFVPPESRALVDEYGNLLIELEKF